MYDVIAIVIVILIASVFVVPIIITILTVTIGPIYAAIVAATQKDEKKFYRSP